MLISIIENGKEYILYSDYSVSLEDLFEILIKNFQHRIQFILRLCQTNVVKKINIATMYSALCTIFIEKDLSAFKKLLSNFKVSFENNKDLTAQIRLEATEFCWDLRNYIRYYI